MNGLLAEAITAAPAAAAPLEAVADALDTIGREPSRPLAASSSPAGGR